MSYERGLSDVHLIGPKATVSTKSIYQFVVFCRSFLNIITQTNCLRFN